MPACLGGGKEVGMDRKDLHFTALFIHAVLFSLHTVGSLYNLRRKNYWQSLIHGSVAAYDLWAVNQHRKELEDG